MVIAMTIDDMDDYAVNLADAYAKDAYQKGLEDGKRKKRLSSTEAFKGHCVHCFQEGYEQGKKDAVKHGHWSQYAEPHEDGKGLYICSVCNELNVMYDDEYKFCPNCGCKMDAKPGGDNLDGEKAE